MNKIVPFKKDIIFDTDISEIISISLDHELERIEQFIKGKFIIAGEYKVLETSIDTIPFNYEIPFTVEMDDRYILNNINIDIDDFYYEIDTNKLKVCIDVLIDNLEEREAFLEEKEIKREELPIERCVEEEAPPIKERVDEMTDTLKETYKSYSVYIVRSEDTIESIIEKYKLNKDIISLYNDIKEIKIGDKLIIPSYD